MASMMMIKDFTLQGRQGLVKQLSSWHEGELAAMTLQLSELFYS